MEGIYNRCASDAGGFRPGQAKTYHVKVTRTSGPAGNRTHAIAWVGNDGTYNSHTRGRAAAEPDRQHPGHRTTRRRRAHRHHAPGRRGDRGCRLRRRRASRRRHGCRLPGPFTNLNGDAAEDYFADGIVDNLTTDLSTHIAGLMVAGRGSAFSFKAKSFDPRQVGLSLGVRYLLQGSVRRTGDQVRVNTQLIEAEQGHRDLGRTVQGRKRRPGASLQDQITAHIANSLGAALIRPCTRPRPEAATPQR